ncbi:MAG: hypothetical protein K0U98_13020 [Deltaproteobacteria bacterium]|nr:hypothetical protein [Deltaproteobacteria bacterium]
MILALVVYVVFSLLAAAGAFWIGQSQRSRSAGVWAAVLTLVFMGSLLAVVTLAVRPLLAS